MGYTTFLPENLFDLKVSFVNVVVIIVILLILVLIFGVGQYKSLKRRKRPE